MNKRLIPVVYIITKLELGGAQKVCLSLFKGLQTSCATHLISGAKGPLVAEISENENVILLSGMEREVTGFWQEIKNFKAIVRTLRQLKKKHSHLIVHTHSTKAGLIGRWAAWVARISTRIHTVHGFAFHEQQSRRVWFVIYLLELLTSLITTHFVCVSAQDAKTGSSLFPRFCKKHSIIRAGVDRKTFQVPTRSLRHPSSHATFIFGTISCFKPQKNLIDLLRAFELTYQANDRARLEIIGDGEQRPLIESWLKEHQLSSVVTLHGWQSSVRPIMKEWHTFALSSLWEGLPCALVEARLQRLPVVSYDTGGIHEVIFDQQNGFLYKKGNWQGLAYGMRRLMTEPHLYQTFQHYPDRLEDYDITRMVNDHLSLYKQLLS